jgi:hypothetical protein
MEITSQLASIEDELKLLKGEIKSILKEIRTAVLSSDNPFSANTSSIRSSSAAPASAPTAGPALVDASQTPPAPVEEPTPFSPRPVELPAPQPQPIVEPQRAAPHNEAQFAEPVSLHNEASARDEPAELHPTSLFTIASLLAWAEDAIGTLGARRFRLMLELAYFAELLSPEVRDVLREVAEIWSSDQEPDRPVNVNECLLQLRQLEAIVNGERVARIPRRRSRRRGS